MLVVQMFIDNKGVARSSLVGFFCDTVITGMTDKGLEKIREELK